MWMSETSVFLSQLDPAVNKARFYVLSLQPTLFGDTAVVRHWGRLGTNGRVRIDLYASREQARSALHALEAIKRRRGYR